QIALALEGDYREEHLFSLKQAVDRYDFYRQQLKECDQQIDVCMDQFESKPDTDPDPLPEPAGKKRKVQGHQPEFDLRSHLKRITGVDFTRIPGLNTLTVQTIISEVGLDPTAFPTAKHFVSWLGLCPANKITGGQVKSSKTRKVANNASTAFRIAAQVLAHSHSALGAFYRRKRAQLGAPKAITAAAHKIARLFYSLWANGGPYKDPGQDYYEEKYQDRVLNNIKRTAKQLGYEITLTPMAPPSASPELCTPLATCAG
ncbi:MAG: IS110 family transposase, partial [Deltaproteobacteria bacterium]|nr:IS110 family transposase [Deltaproteobacteria bacterium]